MPTDFAIDLFHQQRADVAKKFPSYQMLLIDIVESKNFSRLQAALKHSEW